MNFAVRWDLVSINSLAEESEFILKKWNFSEVEIFHALVELSLERLSANPTIGIYNSVLKVHSFVISRQTTLYYTLNENNKTIELHVFWNNLKNPEKLLKLLK
jgi:hypothetical protein